MYMSKSGFYAGLFCYWYVNNIPFDTSNVNLLLSGMLV